MIIFANKFKIMYMNHRNLIINSIVLAFLFFVISCSNNTTSNTEKNESESIEHLTKATFKEKVNNYETGSSWKYKGSHPCIIDFYATWCGPCKRLSPTMDELSKQYEGKVKFYKVDVDDEKELASAFGIQSIPTIYFCPMNGNPVIEYGALPKENIVALIESTFKQLTINN
jgi:thioredoxin 1